MKGFRIFLALFVVLAFLTPVFAGSPADEALQKLMDGNKRFVSGSLAQKDLGEVKRKELAKGQKPFAIVLTCSDSRVPPELLFDQSLGDIFVVRVAGNVVDPIELGSIEYAAEHLNSPLLIILGHSKCGAVKATLETKGEPEGNIGAIVKKIMPAAEKAKKKGGSEDEVFETAIQENVKNVYSDIMKRSKIINHLANEGKLKIVGGEYMLATGKVEMIELPKLPSGKESH
ncbi:MAG: carbonic anhydrase [Nitrospirota bacterium]